MGMTSKQELERRIELLEQAIYVMGSSFIININRVKVKINELKELLKDMA